MATKSVDESKMMLRMSDFTSEPKRMLPPIKGYEKEPILSLEKAIEPLIPLVPDVEEMVWTVKQNCQHPQDHLSSDESASIMLYTLEWMPCEHSFYFILNKTLRSQNRQELLPWFLFLRLFMVALAKLPTTKHRIIYRGIKMDVSDEFPEGKTFIWWSFSSCSSSIKVLEQFLGESGHRTMFNIECDSAKDISRHSFYQSENEVLMYPARQFQVVSSFNSGNQLKIIQVKEIQPPFPLIYIPPTPSSHVDQIKDIEPSLSVMHISEASSTNATYQNERLRQLIQECEPRSKVDLQKQNLNDEDMKIVVKEAIINKQCKTLELSKNNITSDGASMIAQALNNNTTLEVLYLDGNRFSDKGICALTKTLSHNNSKVDILSFQGSDVTDKGAEYIAEMLKTNTTLKHLLLGGNEISDRGVQRLANVLTYNNTTLRSLRLRDNELVSNLSIDSVIQMLKQNLTLKCLTLDGCNLSDEGKQKLRQTVRSKKGFELDV